MVHRSIFVTTQTITDGSSVRSRNATVNLLRYIFSLGIRTPPKRFFVAYCLWSIFLNVCVTFYQPFAFLTSYVEHFHEMSMGEFLNSLQIVFNTWACSAKVLIIWKFEKQFDRANDSLDKMDEFVTHPSERRKLHQISIKCNRLALIYSIIYLCVFTSNFVTALIRHKPPYQNYYPVLDWHASNLQYWCQTLIEYLSMAAACYQNSCCDSYGVVYLLVLRTHMSIFKERLRLLGSDVRRNNEERLNDLINCIEHHKAILRFCDTLRPLLSGTLFVQLIVVGLVLGIICINIATFTEPALVFPAIFFMIAVLMETTPLCILCTYLADDCDNLALALFHSNWLDADQRYKKVLLYFLQQLQIPIQFMAANIFPINIATNITMTKFGVSVFTVVQHMNLGEKFERNHVEN